jgi:catechol 2,3-dioxygenase-like lactoylglutathione lyase family enzyme
MRSKLALLAFLLIAPLTAQLAPPNPAGVRMGHIHLFVPDVDAQKAFWVAIMGGRLVKNNGFEMIQFPGAFILLTHSAEPREPPAGAIVNHFGFVVKDMPAMLARWKANNLRVEPTENPN